MDRYVFISKKKRNNKKGDKKGLKLTDIQRRDLDHRIYYANKYKADKGIEMCVVYDKSERLFQGWPLIPEPKMPIVYRTDGGELDITIEEGTMSEEEEEEMKKLIEENIKKEKEIEKQRSESKGKGKRRRRKRKVKDKDKNKDKDKSEVDKINKKEGQGQSDD